MYRVRPLSTLQGLTEAAAHARLLIDGPNALSPPKQKPEIVKFLEKVFLGFAILLWAGAVFAFTAYGVQKSTQANTPGDNVSLTSRNSLIPVRGSL